MKIPLCRLSDLCVIVVAANAKVTAPHQKRTPVYIVQRGWT